MSAHRKTGLAASRSASSADRLSPSDCPQNPAPRRDRGEKAQQQNQLSVDRAVKGLQQRSRQIRGARRWRERAVNTPERTVGEHGAPPLAPAHHRAPTHPDQGLQALHPGGVKPALHRRDQHHHRAQAHLATEKAERRGCLASSAPVLRTTQAKAAQMLRPQAGRHTARFAAEGSPMKLRPALSTRQRMRRIGHLPVKAQQQLVKPGIPQDRFDRLVHVLAPAW